MQNTARCELKRADQFYTLQGEVMFLSKTWSRLCRVLLLSKLAILLCTFIGASTIVVAEPLVHAVPPIFLLGSRFLLAAILLGLTFPKQVFPITRGAVRAGIIAGVGFGLGSALLYVALPHVRSGKLTFLIALEVVIVPVVTAVLYKQRLARFEKIALVFALCGLWLITGAQKNLLSWWDTIGLLSAFWYAVYTISLSRLASSAGVMSRTFVSFACISVLALIISYYFESLSNISVTQSTTIRFLYLVIIGSLVRFILQGWAQRSVSASFTALMFTAEPIFAILLSYSFLGERFTYTQTCGAVSIVCALLLANLPKKGVAVVIET